MMMVIMLIIKQLNGYKTFISPLFILQVPDRFSFQFKFIDLSEFCVLFFF